MGLVKTVFSDSMKTKKKNDNKKSGLAKEDVSTENIIKRKAYKFIQNGSLFSWQNHILWAKTIF